MAIPDLKVPSFSVPDLKVPDLKVPDLHIAGAYNVYNHRRTSVQRQHLKLFFCRQIFNGIPTFLH